MANKKEKVVDQYAKALLAYGEDQDSFDSLLADLKVVTQVVESTPKLTALLAAQTISEEDQVSLLDTLTNGADQAVVNLTKILLSHHHFALLEDVSKRFVDLYQDRQGIQSVTITTAVAVDDDQKKRLEDAFQKQSGAKKVEASYRVLPDLLAGVSMQSKSILIDGSLKTKIAKLQAELLG